jgi:hypothetical protein
VFVRPHNLTLALCCAFLVAACQSAPEQPASGETPDQTYAQAPVDVGDLQDPGPCRPSEDAWIWTMPSAPRADRPTQIVAISTAHAIDQLYVTDPSGARRPLRADPAGGPPWSLLGSLFTSEPGIYRIDAVGRGQHAACAQIEVGGGSSNHEPVAWDLPTEALYAVWIERLFDGPPEQSVSWPSLTPVLTDPTRNLLYGYLGSGEDNRLIMEPDCADLPYILRAYFAWKLGLPIAYRACSRGSASSPPRCESATADTSLTGRPASTTGFSGVSRRIMDTVHSGSVRTALRDDATDFYPVPLERETLWPGTVFADPYGHILVLVKWVPQTGYRSGMLLAVDAQPDNSVSRKRFWEGTFLFADSASAGPGFKAMRPLTRAGSGWRPMPNAMLAGAGAVAPYSTEQAGLSPDAFYARMQRLINPAGLDPTRAYEDTLAALMEQLQTRVASVERGEAYVGAHRGQTIPMPSGAAIFETTGPWEDYSTPSRDMRLLIAMKVLDSLPERIRRHPELYRLGGETPQQAAARISALHATRTQERTIEYRRSDGSPQRLTLAEIYDRRPALEIAYNPNDCVERRWGAPAGSDELATCNRRAPKDQQARMEQYRSWFRDTRRPPR